jgi:hypothetical protein
MPHHNGRKRQPRGDRRDRTVLYDNKVNLGKNAVTKLLLSGEFVTRSSSGTLGFTTWTSGRPNDYVTVTNSGRLAVIGVSTKTLWSTQ